MLRPAARWSAARPRVGVVDKDKMINPENVQPGDVLIALPSSGVHSNGFSLVRKVFELEEKPRNIFREFNGSTLGETLLTPTRLYVKPMLKLIDAVQVKSIVHVTGGGFYENIPRALNARTKAVIDRSKVRVLPVFEEIQKVGNISEHDMFNTFNMGVGMIAIVAGNRDPLISPNGDSLTKKQVRRRAFGCRACFFILSKGAVQMVKIAVLVSGGGTNLQALIDRQQAGELGCGQIGLVLSSRPGVYALERAQKAGIETVVVDRKSCATAEEFSARVLHQLQSRGVEMVVLAGFLSILCKDMVEAYPNRIINVHPSLIPSFCGKGFYGLKVHQAALDYGVKVTGATVHYVNEVTDGGSIILQKAVYIEPDDTPETLQRRVMEQAEWELLPKATAMVCQRIQEEKDRQ